MKKLLLATLALAGAGSALAYTQVGSGYTQPVFLTAPTGDSRLFVVEKGGLIKVQQGSSVSTWLDISTQVDAAGERGLLGLAFDPGFASNGRFYVDYIDKATLNTVVASYIVNASGAVDMASANTVAATTGRQDAKRFIRSLLRKRPSIVHFPCPNTGA